MALSSFQIPAFLRRDGVQQAFKALLALGAMGYLVYLVEPADIATAMAEARYDVLAAAVLLIVPNLLLEGTVWQHVLTAVVPNAQWRSIYGALLCGFSLGLVTPARAGELAGRALFFARGDRWAIAATVFVQRLLSMLAAMIGGTAALGWALATGVVGGTLWLGLFAAGLTLTTLLAGLLLWPRRGANLADRLISSASTRKHLDFLRRLQPGRMVRAAGLALLRLFVYSTQFVLFAKAFSPEAPLALLYGGVGLVFFAKHLIPPVTMLDVGIREGAAVFFLSGLLGLPEATAFNAAFFVFLTNLVLPAAFGTPFLMRLRLEKAEQGEQNDVSAEASAEP